MIARCATLAVVVLASQGCGLSEQSEPRFAERGDAAPSAPERRSGSLARAAAHALPKDALSRSMKGLAVSKDKDGIVKLDLAGRFHHASVAFIGPDGKMHTTCVDGVSSDDSGANAQ